MNTKTFQMVRILSLATVLAAAGVLGACSSDEGTPKGFGDGTGGDGAGARGNGDGGTGATTPDGKPLPEGCENSNVSDAFSGVRDDPGLSAYRAPTPTCACTEGDEAGSRDLRRLTREELTATWQAALPGLTPLPALELGPDAKQRMTFTNDTNTLKVGRQTAGEFLAAAETVAAAATEAGAIDALAPCVATTPDRACAGEVVKAVGTKLFRRPVADAEAEGYLEVFDGVLPKADFATAVQWTLVSLLQSPYTVYRSELGDPATDGQPSPTLTPYEIASELSYTFSGGPPDAALLARAEAGELSDPQVRIDEAKRLLTSKDGSGAEVINRMFDEWLQLRKVTTSVRNSGGDEWEQVRRDLALEARFFVETVVFRSAGGFNELLTSSATALNPTLASFYGDEYAYSSCDAGNPEAFCPAARPADRGVGILGLGAVTAAAASTETASPTQRGLLLLERMFCTPRPLPENNVDMDLATKTGTTTREKLEAHAGVPACASCHEQFDPLGFAFEHYDETGRWRETDNGAPVDPTTNLNIIDGREIASQEALASSLAESSAVKTCVSGTFAQYVYGSAESCRGATARAAFEAGEMNIQDFIANLAGSPHFVTRQ